MLWVDSPEETKNSCSPNIAAKSKAEKKAHTANGKEEHAQGHILRTVEEDQTKRDSNADAGAENS
jgi:hypothetical protein